MTHPIMHALVPLICLALAGCALVGCTGRSAAGPAPASIGASTGSSAGPMAQGPLEALNHLRLLEYRNEVEAVLAYLANDAAREFVLSRSRDATRKNIQAIQEGRYGFTVLDSHANGDAGVTLLRIANLDSDEPIKLTPFYLWRIAGVWHFLPNPTVVNTWYQQVPKELHREFTLLGRWYKQAEAKELQRVAAEGLAAPEELARQWAQEMQEIIGQ